MTTFTFGELRECSAATIDRVRLSCATHGLFLLSESPSDGGAFSRAVAASRTFFGLPLQTKLAFGHARQAVRPSEARGYSAVEQLSSAEGPDHKQLFDLGLESDIAVPFHGRTRFPSEEIAPDFEASLLALQAHVMGRVAPIVSRCLARVLGRADVAVAMEEPHADTARERRVVRRQTHGQRPVHAAASRRLRQPVAALPRRNRVADRAQPAQHNRCKSRGYAAAPVGQNVGEHAALGPARGQSQRSRLVPVLHLPERRRQRAGRLRSPEGDVAKL